MFRKEMLNNLEKIKREIHNVKQELATLPDGTLICSRSKNGYNWYQSTQEGKKYIPKSNQHLASQLAYKNYLQLQLQKLENEQHAIESYLQIISSNPKLQRFNTHPEFQNLLSAHLNPTEKVHLEWENSPYEKNEKHPEKLLYKIASGNAFRSKSESIIALCLEKYHISYKYEKALYFNEIVLYPDFTILHPRTGQIIYWEHFGLMDQSDYAKNTYSKLLLYTSHGIIPTIHIITTFETQKNPLDIAQIEALIKHHFLSY